MKRKRKGGFAHIRVHLLRILWKKKGGFTHIRVLLLRILWREGRKEDLHISGSIY